MSRFKLYVDGKVLDAGGPNMWALLDYIMEHDAVVPKKGSFYIVDNVDGFSTAELTKRIH